MDALDRRILREVQRDCLAGAAMLAERCGTTESTALRRLGRLRQAGVIKREVAIVDPLKVGRGLIVILNVRLERETTSVLEAFRRRLLQHPDVGHCYFVTGTWDYVLILNLADMAAYNRFLSEMIVGQPAVVATDTHVVLSPLKTGGPLPIDDPAEAQA